MVNKEEIILLSIKFNWFQNAIYQTNGSFISILINFENQFEETRKQLLLSATKTNRILKFLF
jgi:hypothetical protein